MKYEIKNRKTGKPLNEVKVTSRGNQAITDINGLYNKVSY